MDEIRALAISRQIESSIRRRAGGQGFRVFIDMSAIAEVGGDLDTIERALDQTAVFIPIVSRRYLANDSTMREYQYFQTLRAEDSRRAVCPIFLDDPDALRDYAATRGPDAQSLVRTTGPLVSTAKRGLSDPAKLNPLIATVARTVGVSEIRIGRSRSLRFPSPRRVAMIGIGVALMLLLLVAPRLRGQGSDADDASGTAGATTSSAPSPPTVASSELQSPPVASTETPVSESGGAATCGDVLFLGCTGGDALLAEQLLTAAGFFESEPNETFGENAVEALIGFERCYGLPVERFLSLGSSTWNELAAAAESRHPSYGAVPCVTPSTIAETQGLLNDAGYNAGDVDSNFGPKTEAALRLFEFDNAFDPDGRIVQGGTEWSVLVAAAADGATSANLSVSPDRSPCGAFISIYCVSPRAQELEEALWQLEFLPADETPNDYFGAIGWQALVEYQTCTGSPASGAVEVDSADWTALVGAAGAGQRPTGC